MVPTQEDTMTYPGNLVSVCTLHRAESAAQQLTAQLRAFESNNDHPGLFADLRNPFRLIRYRF